MTYKSTEAHILMLERTGRLILFEPKLGPGEVVRRRLWLHPRLSEWVQSQRQDDKDQRYFDAVRSFLKAYVTGRDFDDDARLRRLKTNFGAWYEFRITFN